MQQTDMNKEALQPGSTATPFSTFFWAALKATVKTTPEADDWVIPEAQFAGNVEWDMMNNGQIRKGKQEVIPFLKAGGTLLTKNPTSSASLSTREWGVLSLLGFFIKAPPEAHELWPWCSSFWEPKASWARVPVESVPRPSHHLGSTCR